MNHQRRRGIRRPRRRYYASADIQHMRDLPPGTPVVLWCRESTKRQNNGSQLDGLLDTARAAGLPVADECVFIGPAHEAEAQLAAAGNLAARNGAVLLAECTSRFARAAAFDATDARHVRAGRWTIKEVCDTCGVPLATVLHPDATLKEEKAYQMRRGQQYTGNYGGRPPRKRPGSTKERRLKLLPRVLRMRLDGYSNRAIGRELGVAESTIRDWLERCDI